MILRGSLKYFSRLSGALFLAGLTMVPAPGLAAGANPAVLRAPSVPLVACDPYFSVWSPADKLTDATTVHWTGKPHPLSSLIRIDDRPFRLMGTDPADVPALPQTSTEILPTRTICQFDGEGVRVTMTFMTPALPEDLMVYSRPVTYLTWTVQSTDGASHQVQIHFDAGAELAVNTTDQAMDFSETARDGLKVLKLGSVDQPVLMKKGDDLRIDWGYLYLVGSSKEIQATTITIGREARARFAATGSLPPSLTGGVPRRVSEYPAVLATLMDLGKVGSRSVSRFLVLAYDDVYSIQYFKTNLRPYWRRDGDDASALLRKSVVDYPSLVRRCAALDNRMMTALYGEGGGRYANLCALAYRQCCAANKLVADPNGQPLLFPKENFSNGCIGTVDIIYPMGPQFLWLSRSLTKAMLVPILDYAASPRWRWPFAPHDLGTYPLANGQVYGGGERTEEDQMPVEETGNMLLLLAALAQVEGNADFCKPYWPILEKWADYLQTKGFDPENQLCTDDFAGHLAHNVNLSAKAICGLGAFGRLCEMRGDKANADRYVALAKEFAGRWIKEADDANHYRLAFDKVGTWSQKYNLVWDRILGLGLFPDAVRRKEMDFYKQMQNPFGLPLDNRKDYTKLDWTIWTATLTQDRSDFDTLVEPVCRFLNETPDRVPMSDWYWTKNGRQVGFQARAVVGGVFIQMLYNRAEWKKWNDAGDASAAGWAAIPAPTILVQVVPTSEEIPATWFYTTQAPAEGWFKPGFDTGSWKQGQGGFGTKSTPGAVVRTDWSTPRIWLRREISLPDGKWDKLGLKIHHDEDAEVYLNGVLAAKLGGYLSDYEFAPISPAARATLKSGANLIAVHCRQTGGGQYIDVGLAEERPSK